MSERRSFRMGAKRVGFDYRAREERERGLPLA